MRFSKNLAALVSLFGFAAGPMPLANQYQRYHVPGGKIYRSRSRYTPGGPNRNCGDRGISPKKLRNA